MEKFAVVFEYDLDKGVAYLARRCGGQGAVAVFDSRRQAEKWAHHTGEIAGCYIVNVVRVE